MHPGQARRRIDATTGREVQTVAGHTSAIKTLVELPDGLVAGGSQVGTMRLWVVGTGGLVRTLPHGSPVWSAAALKGGLLASGAHGGTVTIWRGSFSGVSFYERNLVASIVPCLFRNHDVSLQ